MSVDDGDDTGGGSVAASHSPHSIRKHVVKVDSATKDVMKANLNRDSASGEEEEDDDQF